MMTPTNWRQVARQVRSEVSDDRLVLSSAGVAFFGFLSLIPALASLVAVAGLVLAPDTVAEQTTDLFANLPAEARTLLSEQLETIASRGRSALSFGLIVGLALSLWSASSGMGHLIGGVGLAFDTRDGRSWVVRKALALGFTAGAVVFVALAVIGLAGLPTILDALDTPGWLQALAQVGLGLVLVAGFVLGVGLLYRYAPDRERPRWRWITWGAALAVALWILASLGLRLWAASFGSYDRTYGSLAAVAVLLTWLLITALAVLLGAEINAVLERQAGDAPADDTPADNTRPADEVASDSEAPADRGRGLSS